MTANEGVVETSGAVITRGADTIPQLPNLGFQQQQAQDFRIDINPPFGGRRGAGVDIQLAQAAQSQDVRTQAAGLPMLGPFGVVPQEMQRVVRRCPPSHRLAKDGLCYPKALLAKRSKLRMWPAEPAPPITRAEGRSLATRDRTEKKIKTLGKRAGLKVTG